jgi:hypothetical protein
LVVSALYLPFPPPPPPQKKETKNILKNLEKGFFNINIFINVARLTIVIVLSLEK